MQFLRPRCPPKLPAPVTAHADSALNQISLEYSYGELQQATRNFDASVKLGSGSYGGVYKGVMKDGIEVAIKVLDVPDEAGFEEEVKVLSKFRHPNLVILMGFARHGSQRALVYELLAGGDVHKRLHRSCVEGFPFPWKERVSIALDAALGLSHLHHSSPKVFHRDIKTPNILLDKNGTAKMADFGLSCLSHASAHRVKQASGTVGYACPLYVQRGVVTEGSEVYSFGMVLLELLTASPPAYMANGNAATSQIQYLANHIKGDINIVLSLVDTKAQWTPPAARAIGDFALSCIKMQEEQRPNFAEIVRTIRGFYDGSAFAAVTPASSMRQPSPTEGAQRPALVNQAFSAAHRSHVPSPAPSPQGAAAAFLPGGRSLPCHRQGSPSHSPCNGYSRGAPCDEIPAMRSPQNIPDMTISTQNIPTQMPGGRVTQAPVLFALECIFSEGIHLLDVPRDQRLIVHKLATDDDAIRGAPLPPLRVGRIFQTALFDALVSNDNARSTISREHFQVWAEEAPSPPLNDVADSRLPCTFCLTNFSGNGTYVNDKHLQARGERSMLHHGDVITLSRSVTGHEGTYQARFIQLRFDLSDSCLRPAEWFDAGVTPRSDALEETQPLSDDGVQEASGSDNSTSYEGELAFYLEVCGPAVRDLPLDRRRLEYSPPVGEEGEQPHLYSALFVGRAQQHNFWQEVLGSGALKTLSRQHFEVQTWRSVSSSSEASFSFLVRNLSDVNPIHVRGGPEETTEEPPSMLAKGEQHHLLDGDEIVLNLNQDHTFWLIFRDLTKSTSIVATSPGQYGFADVETVVAAAWNTPSTRQGRPASVLRPPFSLMMKDEDTISTAATPHDLYHEEQEEEDDDDDVTHVAMNLNKGSGHAASQRRRAYSHGDVGPISGMPTLMHNSRSIRESGNRTSSPSVLAGSRLHDRSNMLNMGASASWHARSDIGKVADPYRKAPWAHQRCRAP